MKLTLADGRVLDASDPLPIDIVMMERKYSVGAGVLNTPGGQRVEYALFLAWNALKRTGAGVAPKFDEFLADIADFEDEDDTLDDLRDQRDVLSARIAAMEDAGTEGGGPLDASPQT